MAASSSSITSLEAIADQTVRHGVRAASQTYDQLMRHVAKKPESVQRAAWLYILYIHMIEPQPPETLAAPKMQLGQLMQAWPRLVQNQNKVPVAELRQWYERVMHELASLMALSLNLWFRAALMAGSKRYHGSPDAGWRLINPHVPLSQSIQASLGVLRERTLLFESMTYIRARFSAEAPAALVDLAAALEEAVNSGPEVPLRKDTAQTYDPTIMRTGTRYIYGLLLHVSPHLVVDTAITQLRPAARDYLQVPRAKPTAEEEEEDEEEEERRSTPGFRLGLETRGVIQWKPPGAVDTYNLEPDYMPEPGDADDFPPTLPWFEESDEEGGGGVHMDIV